MNNKKINIVTFILSIFLFVVGCNTRQNIASVIIKDFQNDKLKIEIVIKKTEKTKKHIFLFGEMKVKNLSNDGLVNFFPMKKIFIIRDERYEPVYIDSIASVGISLKPSESKTYDIYVEYSDDMGSLKDYRVFLK